MISRDDIRLELKGFEAGSAFGGFAKGLVDDLYLDAPSDASLTASFTRFEDHVTGAIQISSSQGVFSATAGGVGAEEVAQKIVRRIRKQLSAWKQSRWERDRSLMRSNEARERAT